MLLACSTGLLKLRHLPGLCFLLSTSFPLSCELDSICCTLPGALCLLCLSHYSQLVKPIRRSAGRCVRCGSSLGMSRCDSMVFFLRELAGTSRYCALCAYFFQLFFIFDVESTLSASAAVAACRLLMGGARRLFLSCQVFPGGRVGR